MRLEARPEPKIIDIGVTLSSGRPTVVTHPRGQHLIFETHSCGKGCSVWQVGWHREGSDFGEKNMWYAQNCGNARVGGATGTVTVAGLVKIQCKSCMLAKMAGTKGADYKRR
jgi:hypothetical protein